MVNSEIKNWFYNFCVGFKSEISILLVLFVSFITPIIGLFYIVGTIVMADTIYAIYYSVKTFGIKSIKSHNMFNLVVKTFFYMGTILIAYLISKYIFDGSLFGIPYFTPKLLCGFWVLIELKSLDETSVKLGNRPFMVILKSLIDKAKSFKKDLNELKK